MRECCFKPGKQRRRSTRPPVVLSALIKNVSSISAAAIILLSAESLRIAGPQSEPGARRANDPNH